MSERIPVRAEGGGLAELLLSHLDSAYNLARWLVRNGEDAEDVVQEAYLRAFQFPPGSAGATPERGCSQLCATRRTGGFAKRVRTSLSSRSTKKYSIAGNGTSNPEELLLQNADGRLVQKALSELPVRFREILVLRELEGLSYKEIADIMGVPMGTVMSTLSRARDRFRKGAGRLVDCTR